MIRPGYQFKTDGAYTLLLRGPINMPKDGLASLESIVDTSLLPCTVTIHWQFTYPPAHHPFGSRRAFRHDPALSQSGRENLAVEVIRFEVDPEQGSFKLRPADKSQR